MSVKSNVIFFFLSFIYLFFLSSALVYAGNPPDASNSSLTATEVPADGATQSTITVVLEDSSGTPLAGDTVQLSNSTDSTLAFATSSATLDSSGSAIFTATSTTAGTDSIDVTDTTTNTLLSALGQIIFDPLPTATPAPTSVPSSAPSTSPAPTSTSCTNTPPATAPTLYQINSVSGSATLYFAPPSSGFDGFTISYGLDSNADSYNVSFSQGPTSGAIMYTVNDLTPDTTYYFEVRANNGCAPGPWSSILSSNSSGGTTDTSGTSTPVTGSSDMLYLGLTSLIMSAVGFGVFAKFN
jgi:hypothetical protein